MCGKPSSHETFNVAYNVLHFTGVDSANFHKGSGSALVRCNLLPVKSSELISTTNTPFSVVCISGQEKIVRADHVISAYEQVNAEWIEISLDLVISFVTGSAHLPAISKRSFNGRAFWFSSNFFTYAGPSPAINDTGVNKSIFAQVHMLIPDGYVHAPDVFKSDERFRLDADDDVDWRTNLFSETKECGSRRESDFSKKVTQGDIATSIWQESAGMEYRKDTRSDTEREIQFSWTRDNKSVESVECEQERHEIGECPQDKPRKEDSDSREKKRVDDYTVDHENYDVGDKIEDDLGGKKEDRPEIAVFAPGQSEYGQSVVTSIAPSETGEGPKDCPNQFSSKRSNVSLNSGNSTDQYMCHPLFGDDALHKLLSQNSNPSYWAATTSKESQKTEAGELTSPGHISGCSETVSQSFEHALKQKETNLGGSLSSGDERTLAKGMTLKPPKALVNSTSVECTTLRSESEVIISPKQRTAAGKAQATEATKSIWLSKDDNLDVLLVQSLNSEREQLNTGKVESARLRIGYTDVLHLANKKDLKAPPPPALMPFRQKNQLDPDRSIVRSKVELKSPPLGRVSGSRSQALHPPPQNAKMRRSELNISSLHGLSAKAKSTVPPTATKKTLSMQNSKPDSQRSCLERSTDDSGVSNKGKARKGKSNEELENHYMELIGNVANMATSAHEKCVTPASTFEQLQAPAPSKILQLNEHLNDLSNQIAEERQQKQQLIQRFAERNQEFERIAKDKQDLWEGKLRELQKDKYALQVRLQALEAEDPRQKIKRASESVNLTEGELRRLRQEIMEQEALIKGYQVENEKAVKRLKDIEARYKERAQLMAEENTRLASQLANIQFAGCQTTIYGSTPNASKEIHSLRTALHELQSREATLKLELNKERKASEELGKSIMNLNQNSETEVGSLKQMLLKERIEHTQAVELKEEKDRMYLESQEALATVTMRLEDQAKIIAGLQSRIELFESNEESGKENDGRKSAQGQKTWNNIQKVKAMKRIDELEKQVKKLEANSKLKDEHIEENQQLLALNIQDGEKVKSLQDEVAALKQQIKDDNSKNIIQSLRHELDQLKQEYSRVCALTQQLKNQIRSSAENDPSAVKKAKDLEKQVEDVRVFYIRKVRDLTKQLADARKETAKMQTNLEARKFSDKFNFKMSKIEETLATKDTVIKKLQLKIKDLEARKGSIKSTDPTLLANNSLKQTTKVEVTDHGEKPKVYLSKDIRDVSCYSQRESTGGELADERKLLKPVLLRRNMPYVNDADRPIAGGEPFTDTPNEVSSLRMQLEASEIAREVLQKTCTETMKSAALMSMQHQQMMLNLKEASSLLVAGSQHTGRREDQEFGRSRKLKNHALELDNAILEERVKNSAVGLSRNTPPRSPRMAQLQFLRNKIEDMEARHKARELEWQRLLHDVKRIPSSKRQENDDHLWQKAFAAKTEEMESFTNEVDLLLEAALAFQRSHLESGNKKKATP
ncbi:hypothetical protein R1flu_014366 [Riccia fluitans]|uniref:Centrosomal protein of 162 kDa n=1 Tax=Riccia fluitans TaxID=41844 RepID=A0ABD1YGL3_9MARC